MSSAFLDGPDGGDVTEAVGHEIECVVCGEMLPIDAFPEVDDDDFTRYVPCFIEDQDAAVVAQLGKNGPFVHVSCASSRSSEVQSALQIAAEIGIEPLSATLTIRARQIDGGVQ